MEGVFGLVLWRGLVVFVLLFDDCFFVMVECGLEVGFGSVEDDVFFIGGVVDCLVCLSL